MDPCCYLRFMFICLDFSLQAGIGLTSWLVCVVRFLVFCHLSIWCSGSGMAFDCTIDS